MSTLYITNFSGGRLFEVPYDRLEIGFNFNRPGYINFEVDKSAIPNPDYFFPYKFDYEFSVTAGTWQGMITGLDFDYYGDTYTVSGQDYLHYMERRTHDGLDGTPTPYSVTSRRVVLIIKDLFDKAATNGVAFVTSSIPTTVGPSVNYRIEPGDSESLLSKVMTLADAYGMYVRVVGKNVNVYGAGLQSFPQAVYAEISNAADVIAIRAEQKGIKGTDVVTLGGGSATNTKLYAKNSSSSARTTYRRHDIVTDLGNVAHQSIVSGHNYTELIRSIEPMWDIRITRYNDTWIPLMASFPLTILLTPSHFINDEYTATSSVHRTDDGGKTFTSEYQLDLNSLYNIT